MNSLTIYPVIILQLIRSACPFSPVLSLSQSDYCASFLLESEGFNTSSALVECDRTSNLYIYMDDDRPYRTMHIEDKSGIRLTAGFFDNNVAEIDNTYSRSWLQNTSTQGCIFNKIASVCNYYPSEGATQVILNPRIIYFCCDKWFSLDHEVHHPVGTIISSGRLMEYNESITPACFDPGETIYKIFESYLDSVTLKWKITLDKGSVPQGYCNVKYITKYGIVLMQSGFLRNPFEEEISSACGGINSDPKEEICVLKEKQQTPAQISSTEATNSKAEQKLRSQKSLNFILMTLLILVMPVWE